MNEFEDFLKNGFPDYDAPYVKDQQFVMMIKSNNKITYSFANIDYNYLAGYPNNEKDYNDAKELLNDELKFYNSSKGVIFENTDGIGNFKCMAYIDKNELKKEGISR